MEKVLTDFVKALRNSNVRVSPAETLDAVAVIDTVGYELSLIHISEPTRRP